MSNLENLDSLKGHPQIWKGPIAYLVLLTISINVHKPIPYMFSIAVFFGGGS